MPALSSFITYRPGKKAKAAIRSPFSLLRGDSATASSSTSHQPFTPPAPDIVEPIVVEPDVIDINHSHYSDDGFRSASFEQDGFDNTRSSQHNLSASPQVELDIDLSSNGFSDWLEAFSSGDPKKEALARRYTRNQVSRIGELKGGEGEADRGPSSSEDMVTSFQALDAEHDDILQESLTLKHPYSMSIPDSSSTDRQVSRPPDLFIGTRITRPLSSLSVASSAISGTTIARALMSNSFILSTDRSSLHRSGTGAGLTRTDSATLPNWEWNSHSDRFSIGSDAPPIPLNAELLYEPPRISRNEGKRSKSSTASLSPKIPSETPSINNNTRLNSTIVNADDFDLETFPPGTLPHTPPRVSIDEAMTPDRASQQTTVESQLLSQDSDTLSSPSSSHTSPKELEGLLNYYSLPDSPELLIATRGFRPMFSPITEESASQSSPPTPYRSDKRDSLKSQLVGGRSPLRARDSTVLPKDSHPESAQANIASVSSTTISDSSFYDNGTDNLEVTAIPPQPQPTKIFSRSRSASIPVKVVRNSGDMDTYNLTTASSYGDPTLSAALTPMVSQEFPETPNPFSPMLSSRPNAPAMSSQPVDGHEKFLPSMSTVLESVPTPQPLPKRISVQHSRQGSSSQARSSSGSGSPSIRIDRSESPELIPPIISPIADDVITEPLPSSNSESSTNPSNISLSLEAIKYPDSSTSSKSRSLPTIPMVSPFLSSSPDDEFPPISPPGPSTMIPVVFEETIFTSSATPSSTVRPSVSRGRLPSALTIAGVAGDGPVAVNGTVQEEHDSAELEEEPQEPEHYDSHEAPAFSPKGTLFGNVTYRGRASDLFRGTSLGSPPPYYSVVNEALQNNRFPNNFAPPMTFSQSQGSDNAAGPSSGESTLSSDMGRPRESTQFGPRTTRTRPPLPAGPRRPSQTSGSPGPRRGSFSSVSSSNMVPDPRLPRLPPPRFTNPIPSPNFQPPTPKWKGYTLEVAKWTFTSAQLQAIVSKAIRRSAESSSIRLLRLEVLDNDIPEEIQMLESQRTNVKTRYKAMTRRRAIILDSMYSLEDAHGLVRQLDELRELTLTLDRLAEELHSLDLQLSYLESLTHVHNGSALAIALRKLNTSFLRQVAENQVLRGQIQSLEAERDEAWQQAQNVANEYDQIINNNENTATTFTSPSPSTTTTSNRVSAKRKSCIRVSKAGLRTTISRRPSQRFSAGGGVGGVGVGSVSSSSARTPPLPLPIRRPLDILTDSPTSSNARNIPSL